METVIIDYGMGNLLSVQRAFEKCGSDAVIIDNPLDLREAEHIVLPGVGAFPDAMNNLRDGGWIEELNRAVLEKETPILGICLGMQLLAERGYEVWDIFRARSCVLNRHRRRKESRMSDGTTLKSAWKRLSLMELKMERTTTLCTAIILK
mgnify:CR=1 FL=1